MCKNLNPQQIKDFLDTAQQMIKNMAWSVFHFLA
jgi:hypothetical protein